MYAAYNDNVRKIWIHLFKRKKNHSKIKFTPQKERIGKDEMNNKINRNRAKQFLELQI